MNIMTSLPIGLSAATVACILEKSDSPGFWQAHPILTVGMGFSIMFPAVSAGWWTLNENRPLSLSRYAVWSIGVTIACFTLGQFFKTISPGLWYGFAAGLLLAILSCKLAEKVAKGSKHQDLTNGGTQ